MAVPSPQPYFSRSPADRGVHHIYEDCPKGRRIAPQDRRTGVGGWFLCQSCQAMGGYEGLPPPGGEGMIELLPSENSLVLLEAPMDGTPHPGEGSGGRESADRGRTR